MAGERNHVRSAASVEETKHLAAALAAHLRAGDAVVLNGGLGAGKTHFVQGVAEALGVTQPVTSPTFNILQTYDVPGGGANQACPMNAIHHFDLYRLEDAAELDDIGYWEALEGDAASFIEWGDKFPESMPDDYLEVSIVAGEDGVRTVSAAARGPRSAQLLDAWLS